MFKTLKEIFHLKSKSTNGPPLGVAPFFALEKGEAIHIEQAPDTDFAQIFVEDDEEPGTLHAFFMHAEDVEDLLKNQLKYP